MIETYDLTNPERPTIVKDPDATLDYSQRWTEWLAMVSDSIISASVQADAPLIVVGGAEIDGGIVSAMISGGTPLQVHRVTFTIVTSGGRTDQRSLFLRIRQR